MLLRQTSSLLILQQDVDQWARQTKKSWACLHGRTSGCNVVHSQGLSQGCPTYLSADLCPQAA